jgi:hypothetical protein
MLEEMRREVVIGDRFIECKPRRTDECEDEYGGD